MHPLRLPGRISLCAALLLLAACESRPDRHEMMEEARHEVPPMAAHETFFEGAVIAHLSLGNDNGGGTGGDRDSDKGGSHGGNGSGRRGGGRRGMGGGSERGERPSGAASGSGDGAPSASMHRSDMPPAMLRLRLENTTSATVEVEVRELNSELGDFAVRPDKLTLAPGQSGEPDPMESLLGLDTYSLPVTITLRSSGRTETKVLTLQLVKPAPAAPPPNPGG